MEFRLVKGIRDTFRTIAIVVWLCQQTQSVIWSQFKENRGSHGRLHLRLAQTRAKLPHHPFEFIKMGKQEKLPHHIALFRVECLLVGRGRIGVGVGVDIFWPELESIRSRLKFVDSEALGTMNPNISVQDGHFPLPIFFVGAIFSWFIEQDTILTGSIV